ncbi:FecR family protein [Chitinophaga cymbidii]|uniref:Iron dicitrate transporter FecR n=1 Tax=Chitinophaga cymbidii TaxID=1096750 RepID=A0A512RRF5_9BACT|nr:FecR family protein [Chitinophaga cymbidii]GEP98275.1 hypothetical protein CCY01nite_45350 [Chitinophaga cymbidii]
MQDRLAYLVGKAVAQTATDAELEELTRMMVEDQTGEVALQVEALLPKMAPDQQDAAHWDAIADRILSADRPAQVVPMRPRRYRMWAAAAAVLVTGALATFWLMQDQRPAPDATAQQPLMNDVAPGGNKAMLTLADGTQIPLDSSANGTLALQGGTKLQMQGNGLLAYETSGQSGTAPLVYNTITTPRGGQFQVTLSDGSKVWLNAASSLRYPAQFSRGKREVELTGEAYFEVAKKDGAAFTVKASGVEVAVLGTHFNIMAYEDEAQVKTTLLEGAVKVSHGGSSKRLSPGQGASLEKSTGALNVEDHVNLEEAVAWKNGLLQFEGNDIRSAMRLIARWYDVEVVYRSPVQAHFRGIIPRNVNVSKVLQMLEMTGEVHFEIKGKQIIVSP